MVKKNKTEDSRVSNVPQYPGKLIAVEGLDGSGKSTQIYLLKRWMEMQNLKVFFTEWNSSVIVRESTRKGKKRQLLTPTTFSLIHATDFADRFERQVLPLLRAGYIVLADRYMYTAFARDITRGCDPRWVRNLYSFAVVPDITFFFDTPLNVALDRILGGRPKLKYFEAGMDLGLSQDPYESFRLFQGRIYAEYKKMVDTEGFVVMDGMLPVEKQQKLVRKIVEPRIDLPAFRWRGNR
jgi:dTMP kinase